MQIVQLNDEGTQVIAVLGCGQDPSVFLNQAQIPDDDERLASFLTAAGLPTEEKVAVNEVAPVAARKAKSK